MENGNMSELPGDGLEWEDVKDLFEEAAADMSAEEMVFMDGFTLQDAMSAFEIGEPRLDTGYGGEKPPPPFNPLMPMLPEEICWILDRSFAFEMHWHAGDMLSHTVLTLVYVHHLPDIEPDTMTLDDQDPSRPLDLITIVLRSCVQGLLKCCDLTWRQLQGNLSIKDAEDWQSDKCEVSLLEGIPVNFVLSKLENAAIWSTNSPKVDPAWRAPLRARILLRKTLLQIMNANLSKDHLQFQELLNRAREHLHYLMSLPTFDMPSESPAHLAFDPYISRRLNTCVPVRIVPVQPVEQTWKSIDALLDGLEELRSLALHHDLSTWEAVGQLRLWSSKGPRPPYIRSLTQATFFDGLLILNQHSFAWAVDRFFFETIGWSWTSITRMITESWGGNSPPPLAQVERKLHRLIQPHVKAYWLNPPRVRRHFMKSLVDWHALYDILVDIVEGLDHEAISHDSIVMRLPDVALIWRFRALREIVLSGFQVELYSAEEKPFAYWYTARVLECNLDCFDKLLSRIPQESQAYKAMQYASQLSVALQAISTACFLITMPVMSFDWDENRPNFYKRYKWAFRPEYDEIESPVVAQPELHEFMRACMDVMQTENVSPLEHIQVANSILVELIKSGNIGGWVGQWSNDRVKFLRGLVEVCKRLSSLPNSSEELDLFDAKLLKWDPVVHPWFPFLKAPPAYVSG